jgi:hypothetical protein
LRDLGGNEGKHINRRNVDDQRVPFRPLLSNEDAFDRCWVESAGRQSVDGFGRHGDETATAKDIGGTDYCRMMLMDLVAPNWKKDGLHAGN